MIQVFRPSGSNSVEGVLSHLRASNEISKYVGLTFIQHSFNVENYTIRQYDGPGHMTKNWKPQALKGKAWVDIDAQSSESFCVAGILPVIKVKKTRQFYKTFRMISTGDSCSNYAWFRNAGIELFGTLREGDSSFCNMFTSAKTSKTCLFLHFVVFILVES